MAKIIREHLVERTSTKPSSAYGNYFPVAEDSAVGAVRRGMIEWERDDGETRYYLRIRPEIGPQHQHTFSDNPDNPTELMTCLDCGLDEETDRLLAAWDVADD